MHVALASAVIALVGFAYLAGYHAGRADRAQTVVENQSAPVPVPVSAPVQPAPVPSPSPPPETKPAPEPPSNPPPVPEPEAPPEDQEFALPELTSRVEQSVVQVNVTAKKHTAHGSGFFVRDGMTVVSNFHVIDGAEQANIVLPDGSKRDILGFTAFDQGLDLVVLRIAPLAPAPPPLMIREDMPQKGQTVAAFGSPLGFGSTVSSGIVSAIRTGAQLRQDMQRAAKYALPLREDSQWVQFTSPIAHGSSGGPLVTSDGCLAGVCTLSFAELGGENLAFAVSAQHLNELLKADVVRPLADLPPRASILVAQEDASEPPVEVMESTVEFRRALLQVYAKRQELLDQRDALVEQAIALDRDLAEVRTNLTPYERDAAETQRAMVALDQAAARVQQQAASLLTPEDRLRAQAEFDQLRVQYATAGARLRQLNKLAAPLVARINGILTELKHRRAQAAALQVQADQLRQDWLRLVDPFGKWSRGEQERALPILNEWVVLDDGYPMAYICRGFAYHILGQTQPAMADFEKAVALEPKSPYALAARAFALNHHGDRAKARLDLELATRLGRTSDFVSVCGGLVHMQNREWRKAIADFRRACKQNPENSAAQSYLAKLLACCPEDELRDGKEAVDVATKACEATQWKGWFNLDVLSLAHAESGNFELAQEYHEKAIALVPPDARSEISQHGEAITQKMPVRLK